MPKSKRKVNFRRVKKSKRKSRKSVRKSRRRHSKIVRKRRKSKKKSRSVGAKRSLTTRRRKSRMDKKPPPPPPPPPPPIHEFKKTIKILLKFFKNDDCKIKLLDNLIEIADMNKESSEYQHALSYGNQTLFLTQMKEKIEKEKIEKEKGRRGWRGWRGWRGRGDEWSLIKNDEQCGN